MAKGLESDGEPSPSPRKRVGHFLIKFLGSALLLAFSYRLLVSASTGFFVFSASPASEIPAAKGGNLRRIGKKIFLVKSCFFQFGFARNVQWERFEVSKVLVVKEANFGLVAKK